MGETLIRTLVPWLRVASAGTSAARGSAMHPLAERVLAAQGMSPAGHEARQLTAGHIASARLLLTATRAHRSRIIELLPVAVDRCFTIRELGRLLLAAEPEAVGTAPPSDPIGHVLDLAGRQLRRDPPDQHDDIADPIGRPVEAFEHCLVQLRTSLTPRVEAVGVAGSRVEGTVAACCAKPVAGRPVGSDGRVPPPVPVSRDDGRRRRCDRRVRRSGCPAAG